MNNKPEQIKDNWDKLYSIVDKYFEDDKGPVLNRYDNIKS